MTTWYLAVMKKNGKPLTGLPRIPITIKGFRLKDFFIMVNKKPIVFAEYSGKTEEISGIGVFQKENGKKPILIVPLTLAYQIDSGCIVSFEKSTLCLN